VTLRKMLVQFSEIVFLLHWNVKSAPPLLRSRPRSLLYEKIGQLIAELKARPAGYEALRYHWGPA